MNQQHSEDITTDGGHIKGMRVIRDCPLCEGEYELDDMSILKEKNNSMLVHATCPHCNNAVLSVMVVSEVGLSSLGLVTDLSQKDVVRLQDKEPVSDDEFLEFHSLIRKKQLALFKNLDV